MIAVVAHTFRIIFCIFMATFSDRSSRSFFCIGFWISLNFFDGEYDLGALGDVMEGVGEGLGVDRVKIVSSGCGFVGWQVLLDLMGFFKWELLLDFHIQTLFQVLILLCPFL